ncbi:hypothetical protein GFD17_04060 [Bifidobacterium sp. SMB2]|uniref:Uncharacterized protein n=1 Tax=Bifidobacterium saimiriisciurei TaxID=2661627 RepID=A0ABX0CAR8_9BIFI|nr:MULTISPECIES: hypothetical protein [Bifidobacterium]NEG95944.1 hypothetical protein [Bifidobacterium sp. SMB2]NEH11791.1 hypothetical protein [Bifidobacterium saimiriisciurei]
MSDQTPNNPNNTDRDPDSFSDEEINAALAGFEDELNDMDSFDAELQGLLGNKAKAAVLITQLSAADLLAAFCQLSDISAQCVASDTGAVAVLRNVDGDGPEAAARDLTTVISGLSAVLAVNRADKLEATLWVNGKPGTQFAPPVLFMSTPDFVEDLLIGAIDVAGLERQNLTIVDSGTMERGDALNVIAKHTKFGRGGSTRGSKVD